MSPCLAEPPCQAKLRPCSPGRSALCLRIENEGKIIAFTGDTGPLANLAEVSEAADLFICECTLAEVPPLADVRHLTAQDIARLRPGWNTRRVLLFGAVTPTTGTIIMSSNPNNVIQGIDGTEVLTNNITIQGAGNIGNGRLGLVNGTNGQIIASSSSVPLVNGPKQCLYQ